MTNTVAQPVDRGRPWPLTDEARNALIDEIANLRAELETMAGQGLEEGIHRLPIAIAIRRIRTLEDVLDRCEVVADGRAAIGRRAVLRDGDGEAVSYEIVFPGEGDPSRGRISADSPLGLALLGAQSGDVVHVTAPAGGWGITVVALE
jgi:transcription elongation GreA/GreB family factor